MFENKKTMTLKSVLIVGLILTTTLLNAQTDFRPGYVIRAIGDTLLGEIDYRGDKLMGYLCKFKSSENLINDYTPNDIHGYRFIDSKYFVSKKINGTPVFLEYLIKGKVNIYYLRIDNGDHYYIEKDDIELTELPYDEVIKTVDGKDYLYKSKKHVGLLSVYMQDAPDLQNRINNMGKPDHQNLTKLAEDYHNEVCDGEKCIVFEKKQPLIKVNWELAAGTINWVNTEAFYEVKTDRYYFQTGVMANFWMPRLNEKIYFRTGILYSLGELTDGTNSPYIKIPMHIGYMAPSTFKVRPSFSIGLFSPSYCGGISFKINKKMYLGVQGWMNFAYDKVVWIPTYMYNYSLLGTFNIQF